MKNILRKMIEWLCMNRLRRRTARYAVLENAPSLDGLSLALNDVPGMMTFEAGALLHALAATQSCDGDIIEIGSWQGRSTIFLAKAAMHRKSRVFAVDHFLGNRGKEDLYKVDNQNLSNLQAGFKRNLSHFDVANTVTLLAMPSAQAAEELKNRDARARFLFIDGDHEYNGVMSDFNAFEPFLIARALVLFDDYSKSFPGVIRCVSELSESGRIRPLFSYGNCLVVEYTGTRQNLKK